MRREDFKEFLQGMVEENAITADTTWKDLKRSIEDEDAYKAMEGQQGGARDVFDDIVADLRRQVKMWPIYPLLACRLDAHSEL